MTREIKFRAWDKTTKSMHHVEEMMWNSPSPKEGFNPKYIRLRGHGSEFHRHAQFVSSNIVLMQFTGLLDKNGVEIYEGDIVRDILGWEIEVKWFDRHTGFIPFAGGCGEQLSEMCEVIGNIYENPGLLK